MTRCRYLAALTGALALLATGVAAQSMTQDAVIDGRDQVITNSFGNCVRTKWQAASDVCVAAAPKKAVQLPLAALPKIALEQRTVYFAFDKDALQPEATAKLDSLIDALRGSREILHADIIGYADEIGDEPYNLMLSQRRASAVEQYLESRMRIDARAKAVRGLGESRPVTHCEDVKGTAEKIACLAADRRVEIEFKYQ